MAYFKMKKNGIYIEKNIKPEVRRDLKSSEHRLYSVLAGEEIPLLNECIPVISIMCSLHDANNYFTKF